MFLFFKQNMKMFSSKTKNSRSNSTVIVYDNFNKYVSARAAIREHTAKKFITEHSSSDCTRAAGEGGGSLQHLYAMIHELAHDDAPLAIDQNADGTAELPVSTALAADGPYVAAVAVPQHLHSMISAVNYDDVACTVKRDALGAVELTSA
jgi:hypothetical protein